MSEETHGMLSGCGIAYRLTNAIPFTYLITQLPIFLCRINALHVGNYIPLYLGTSNYIQTQPLAISLYYITVCWVLPRATQYDFPSFLAVGSTYKKFCSPEDGVSTVLQSNGVNTKCN
jgi:hypothetical protein